MAGMIRDAALVSRSARLRLAQSGKHWRMLEQGLHLGYRRRATGGTWIAQRRDEGGTYREEKLGLADDVQDVSSDCSKFAKEHLRPDVCRIAVASTIAYQLKVFIA